MVKKIGQDRGGRRRVYFREWRLFRDLTQEQLAEMIGTGKAAISKLERGDVAYSQESLEAIADALRCEPADLISRRPLAPAIEPGATDGERERLAGIIADTVRIMTGLYPIAVDQDQIEYLTRTIAINLERREVPPVQGSRPPLALEAPRTLPKLSKKQR